eukprot:7948457-Pyramimonas_sp.AAC.1
MRSPAAQRPGGEQLRRPKRSPRAWSESIRLAPAMRSAQWLGLPFLRFQRDDGLQRMMRQGNPQLNL